MRHVTTRRRARGIRLLLPGVACGTLSLLVITGSALGGPSGHQAASAAAQRPGPAKYHPRIHVRSHGTSVHATQSDNWSGYNEGYLDKGTKFSSISGQWVVPAATQHTKGQAESSASWVGIGGGCTDTSCSSTDPTLIQAGTEQDVSSSGQASYSAWWEIIPAPSVNASMTVHPGDTIKCSISSAAPGLWTIALTDVTDGQSFSKTVPYVSTGATAEWIEETPVVIGSSGAGISALPNLGKVSFSHAAVNGQSARLAPADEIQLADSSGNVLATPSAPDSTDTAFNDCTYATTCAAP